jgi:hypothetical protein
MSCQKPPQNTAGNIPNTDKFDIRIDRESLLECSAFFPALHIITSVYIICKRNLLMVATRYDANFMNPASITCWE